MKRLRLRIRPLVLLLTLGLLAGGGGQAADGPLPGQEGTPAVKPEPAEDQDNVLGLDEFIVLATGRDTEFEEILIDELTLQYQKALLLPAGDIVLSVKHQHEFFLSQDRDSPDTTVSLSKLFPFTGTEIGVDYEAGAGVSSASISSSAGFSISQPVARNAFGRSTRLLDKIIGLEVEVARHQVIEAYEDYMAVILTAYYNWYEDYESLKVGRSAYRSNVQLLDNMFERQRQKIALPVDVNKVRLQVLAKQERLIELEEQYQNSLNVIERIIRYEGDPPLAPAVPRAMGSREEGFGPAFEAFREESRTFDILGRLEERSSLQVERDADALLPSINLLAGYELSGEEYGVTGEEDFVYAGVEVDWPLPDRVDRARFETSKILERRTRLSTVNTYHRLYTQLRNLYLQMEREEKLIRIADERIALAESVLEDEAENYSFGKITLNDYIQAVNALDTNRFNKITHESLHKKLLVEWLRLTDRLVRDADR